MPRTTHKTDLPTYRGERWIRDGLPSTTEAWHAGGHRSLGKDRTNHHAIAKVLQQAIRHSPWKWPKRPVFFIADPHADAEAFVASLVASGGAGEVAHFVDVFERADVDAALARIREVAAPNPAMCEGCGLCTVTCRGGYIDLEGYSDEQFFAQLGALGPLPEALAL